MSKITDFISTINSIETLKRISAAVAEKALKATPAGHDRTVFSAGTRHNLAVVASRSGGINHRSLGYAISAASCAVTDDIDSARVFCADTIAAAYSVWGSPATYRDLENEYLMLASLIDNEA